MTQTARNELNARILRFLAAHDMDTHDVVSSATEDGIVVVNDAAGEVYVLATMADARTFLGY